MLNNAIFASQINTILFNGKINLKQMTKVNDQIIKEVREVVYDFFAEECEVDVEEITDDSNIITDLGGDSLMFLALIEIFTKKIRSGD